MALTVYVDAPAPFIQRQRQVPAQSNSSQLVPTLNLRANLRFEKGRCTAILGHTGAGKSSLLRCITGLDCYNNARVQYEQTVFQDERTFIPPHRRRFGVVFQHINLFEHISVFDNLSYAIKRRPHDGDQTSLNDAAEAFHIKHLLHSMPATLSGGERQMVALARTALTAPQVLLLDEPLSNIDINSKRLMLQSIKMICRHRNIPVIFITHSFGEVIQLADDVVVMERGAVESFGPLTDISTNLHQSLAKKVNAAVVLEAIVIEHEPQFGLSKALINQQHIFIKMDPNQALDQLPGTCRIRVAAKDVSICLSRPEDSSILNILCGTIDDILAIEETHVLLKIDLGGQYLLSRITAKSHQRLSLVLGQRIFAQMKSVALATEYD